MEIVWRDCFLAAKKETEMKTHKEIADEIVGVLGGKAWKKENIARVYFEDGEFTPIMKYSENEQMSSDSEIISETNVSQEQLLAEILEQLRRNQRSEMFGEFSVTRLIAGIVQVIVLFCLLISIWLLMSPAGQSEALFVSLGFAMVFQIMALTFFVMQGKK